MKQKLEIILGDEYKIKVEHTDKFETSIFKDVYYRSAQNLKDIINQALEKRQWLKHQEKNSVDTFYKLDDYNNIIAFIGERGSGKSSSMSSFAEALINTNNRKSGLFDDFNSYKFLSIDIIDPSLFNDKDTLLEIIISKMFLKFQKKIAKVNEGVNHDDKRKIVTLFQKVFDNLKTLHDEKKVIYTQDTIDALNKLANGTNLKENLRHLVDSFLNFFKSEDGFLVIVIDDLDLNIKGAYLMLEDIRQFLIQSNIIVLIACKIEQLQDSVMQAIIKDYEELLKYNYKLSDLPNKKSVKYLEKLFPIGHRINLPQINSNLLTNPSNNSSEKFIVKNTFNEKIITADSIESGLLKILYEKNDIFISKSSNSIKFLVPDTIRELANFISLCYSVKDLTELKNYILTEINDNLPISLVLLFSELEKREIKYINQFIANWLGENYPYYKEIVDDEKLEVKDELYYILTATNYKNVSQVDILSLIVNLEEISLITDTENYQFLFYLRFYYTLRYNIDIISYDESIYELITPNTSNEGMSIFPRPRGKKRRDFFNFYGYNLIVDNLRTGNLNIEIYYWLSFFITNIGSDSKSYRDKNPAFYDISINKSGPQYEDAKFNWFAFLVTSLEPDRIRERFVPQNLQNEAISLYDELKHWNSINSAQVKTLFNIFFVEELLGEWATNSRNIKEALGDDYEEIMFNYFSDSTINNIFSNLTEKYPYLDISPNIIISNPILKFWRENRVSVKKIIVEIYSSEKNQKKQSLATYNSEQRQLLNYYIVKLPSRKQKTTTISNFINKAKKLKFSDNFIQEIQLLRDSMNGKNNLSVSNKVLEILTSHLQQNG